MRKFLINITLFLGVTLTVYLVGMTAIEQTLRKSSHLDYQNWNDIYSGNVNADIIILGSSRARKMLSPEILEENVGLTVYNLGMEGYKLPFQLAKYDIYTRYNSRPKIVIQIVDHFTLNRRQNLFDIEQFLPYLSDPEICLETKKYVGFSWADYHIPYWRYFGKSNPILAGSLEFLHLKKFKNGGYKGYYPITTNKWDGSFAKTKKENPKGKRTKIDASVYDLLEKRVQSFAKDSIIHFIVYAPEFNDFQDFIVNRDSIENLYQSVAEVSSNCYYLDYKDSSMTQREGLFYDPTHMNSKGAELFSRSLAHFVNAYVQDVF